MKKNLEVYPDGWETMTVEQKLCHMVGKYGELDNWGSDTGTLVLTTTTNPRIAALTGYGVAVRCIQFSGDDCFNLNLLRNEPVKEEDFDETSLPPELADILREDECVYPNIISGGCSGNTCHEAIDRMMLKLELLKHGYRFGNYRVYKKDHPEFFDEEE